jgi:hypothetical protein
MLSRSATVGLMKRAASSAYRLVRMRIGLAPIGESSPCCVALFSIACNGSIARMNNRGDEGSP